MARERHEQQSRIERLVQRHGELSAQVDELNVRTFLTQRERVLVGYLKKAKLAMKDELEDLRRVV